VCSTRATPHSACTLRLRQITPRARMVLPSTALLATSQRNTSASMPFSAEWLKQQAALRAHLAQLQAGLQPRPHRLLLRCQPALRAAPACVLSRSMVLKQDWHVPWRSIHCPLPWRHAHTTHHERMTTRFDLGRAHCSAAPARCQGSHAWCAPAHAHRAAPGAPALPASGRRSASRTALRRWPATAAGAAAGAGGAAAAGAGGGAGEGAGRGAGGGAPIAA